MLGNERAAGGEERGRECCRELGLGEEEERIGLDWRLSGRQGGWRERRERSTIGSGQSDVCVLAWFWQCGLDWVCVELERGDRRERWVDDEEGCRGLVRYATRRGRECCAVGKAGDGECVRRGVWRWVEWRSGYGLGWRRELVECG